jgi:hypothetical protein
MLVGGGENSYIDADDFVAAHPHHFPLLNHAQQLDLQGRAHALHLIQKNAALVRKLKKPQLAAFFAPVNAPSS